MKRIGIAASRIAHGDLFRYNCYVLLIAFLMSLLIFLVSALALIVGLWAVSFVVREPLVVQPGAGFTPVFVVSMATLAVVVGLVNLAAVFSNLKLRK